MVHFKHRADLARIITKVFVLPMVAQLFSQVFFLTLKLNRAKFQVPFLLLWVLTKQVPQSQHVFATTDPRVFIVGIRGEINPSEGA